VQFKYRPVTRAGGALGKRANDLVPGRANAAGRHAFVASRHGCLTWALFFSDFLAEIGVRPTW
jgi:hypothetical protein